MYISNYQDHLNEHLTNRMILIINAPVNLQVLTQETMSKLIVGLNKNVLVEKNNVNAMFTLN